MLDVRCNKGCLNGSWESCDLLSKMTIPVGLSMVLKPGVHPGDQNGPKSSQKFYVVHIFSLFKQM